MFSFTARFSAGLGICGSVVACPEPASCAELRLIQAAPKRTTPTNKKRTKRLMIHLGYFSDAKLASWVCSPRSSPTSAKGGDTPHAGVEDTEDLFRSHD